jgi:photosystem II stability/assembly factor-like uncharacterized protein
MSQWSNVYEDTTSWNVTDLHFFNQDTGVITGMRKDGPGFYLRTTNGADSWTLSTVPNYLGAQQSLLFVNDTIGYSTGRDAIILKTTDQGINWHNHSQVVMGSVGIDANNIIQLNDSVWLLISEPGGISRSQDSLNTWSQVARIDIQRQKWWQKTHAFSFIDDKTCFVTGNGIYKTSDQGLTWSQTLADTNHFYNAMFRQDSLKWFAIGDNGVFIQSRDGGVHWTKSFISAEDLRDITFINDTIGFCIGGGSNLNNFDNGLILTTLDGGKSWIEQIISDRSLNSIQCIDSTCYIVGGNQVFKMQNYNVLDIQNISPQIASLKAWPNPTTDFIEIDIMDGTTLWDIEIYNLTGELILSKKKTNNNRLSLKSVPNGVYFIQLKSGNTTHIGKVVKE